MFRTRGAVILASNHLAVADSFYKCLVVRRRITYLAKAEYFTGTGLKGWFTALVLHRRRTGARSTAPTPTPPSPR